MKVLLIKPPFTRLKGVGPSPYFPLGLGFIAAVLNTNNFHVKIYHAENPRQKEDFMHTDADIGFDFRSAGNKKYHETLKDDTFYVWAEVRQTIEEYQPDLVGITLLSAEVGTALKVASICKEYSRDCLVVWGGVHPTFLYKDCIKYAEVDFVVRGEGEYAMLELCRVLAGNEQSFHVIDGLSFKKDGQVIHNRPRAPIPDIDKIPFPDRDNLLYPESFDFKSLGSMIISRGCPFRCSFCSSRNFWDKRVRFRSPENMIKEIAYLQNKYGTRHVIFWDDSFTINRDVIEKYMKAIIDSGIKITWKASTRADLIDDHIIGIMKNAGCAKLEMGVESGSEKMRAKICKDVTNEQIHAAFNLIAENGIGSGAFFMAGFPEETMADLEETFQFMQQLNVNELAFNVFDPMPGSTEYENCIRLGLVPQNADWRDFPMWPDAHYVKNIARDDFSRKAREIASWVYHRNNSLTCRVRRNKQQILFLLKHDPVELIVKIYKLIKRRISARLFKQQQC